MRTLLALSLLALPVAIAAPAPPTLHEVTVAGWPTTGGGGPYTETFYFPGFDHSLGTLVEAELIPSCWAFSRPGALRLAGTAPIDVTFHAKQNPSGGLPIGDQTVAAWKWSADLGSGLEPLANTKTTFHARTLTVPNDTNWHHLSTEQADWATGSFTRTDTPFLEYVSTGEDWLVTLSFDYTRDEIDGAILNAPWTSHGPAALIDNLLTSSSSSAALYVTYRYTTP